MNAAIPRRISICYKTKQVPDAVLDGVSRLNPGYEVRLFDDAECREFLGGEFGGDHADCFDSLKDGPIRADFWRTCMLYRHGGVYFDADVEHLVGVDEYLQPESTFLTSTSWGSGGCGGGNMNPIALMSRPGSPVLRHCMASYMEAHRMGEPYSYWGWSICRKMHAAFCDLLGRSVGNAQTELIRHGDDVYQFLNEDKSAGVRNGYFTHWRGRRVLNNHRRDYLETRHIRGFKPVQRPYEDDRFRVDVEDHPFPDAFELSLDGRLLNVRRTDAPLGWGQNLMLRVHDKFRGRTIRLAAGPSEDNSKTVEVPMWTRTGRSSSSPRMLLVLAGESFREGNNRSRERDTDESYAPQRRASLSHMGFVSHLREARGMDCDVVLSSYSTSFRDDLVSWYGSNLLAHSFREGLVGLENLIRDAIEEVDVEEYDCALLTRVDIEFKPHLWSSLDLSSQRMLFPSLCWRCMGYLSSGPDEWVPRVSDTMLFVPKRLLPFVKKTFHLSHNAWPQFIDGGLTRDDMGFMLDTFHDSDSAKDYNPLYRMPYRRDATKFHSPNLKVDRDLSPVRTFDYVGFPDWCPGVTRPYEDDDMVVALQYDSQLRRESFSISVDRAAETVTVRRLDDAGGWDMRVVLFVRDKASGQERELFVGRSGSNSRCISLRYEPNHWEDERISVSVRKTSYPDVFHLEMEDGDTVVVTRLDDSAGWGQPLALVVKDKGTGRRMTVSVGPSESESKSVRIDLSPRRFREHHSERVALCVVGAVSRLDGPSRLRGEIYEGSGYVDYKAVRRSVEKHILSANPAFRFDCFLHSWNVDLRADLEYLYRPVASLFEDNEMYGDEIDARCHDAEDFSGVSFALSVKRAIQLKEAHERKGGFVYDKVLIYRPDVILSKDMDLADYEVEEGVFVNGHPGGNGHFHFVMSSEDASLFKGLYDSPMRGNPHRRHHWIRNFVERHMGRNVIADDILPGEHQAVARQDVGLLRKQSGQTNIFKGAN